jgi:hypothetical protein
MLPPSSGLSVKVEELVGLYTQVVRKRSLIQASGKDGCKTALLRYMLCFLITGGKQNNEKEQSFAEIQCCFKKGRTAFVRALICFAQGGGRHWNRGSTEQRRGNQVVLGEKFLPSTCMENQAVTSLSTASLSGKCSAER